MPQVTSSRAYLEEAMNWLPMPDSVTDDLNLSKASLKDQAPNEPFTKRPTLLVADDNADMRQYLKHLLIETYDVVLAENGKKALAKIEQGLMPDLIVSDVLMPEMDGYALLKAVKHNRDIAHIPFLMLSAKAGEEASAEGLKYGADDYLIKPFSARELLARVEARIQVAASQRNAERILKEMNKELEIRVQQRTEELNRSNQLLQKQKDLLQKTLDAIPQMVWVADAQGRIKLLNDRFFTYTGLANEHVENLTLDNTDIFHPSQIREVQPTFHHCIQEGIPYHGEVMVKSRNGDYRWHMSLALPLRNDAGEIEMWVGTFTDLHDQLISEKKQEEAKQLLEAVFNSSTHSIQVLDSIYNESNDIIDFKWKFCNKSTEIIAGKKSLIGQRYTEAFPGVTASGLLDKLKAVARTGESAHFELFYNYDELDTWFDISAVKLEDGIVVTCQDISTRKNADIRLRELNESLQRKNHELKLMNDELSTFAFVASHDLREPLRKVQVFSEALITKEFDNLSDKGKDFFKRMIASVSRMNDLIEDILTFSRISSTPREIVNTDLNDVVENVMTKCAKIIEEKKAVIEYNELPAFVCCPGHMKDLIMHLLSNALKFHKPGEAPQVKISASIVPGHSINHPMAFAKSDYLKLEIADEGIGFEPEYEARVFQMFQRLHARAEYPGTGMGLAICKKIVETQNGFIVAKGNPGAGAVFTCYLERMN
jgi:PAS domain S-box-containing protein